MAGSPEGPPELALKETFRRFRNTEQLHELGSNPFNASYYSPSRCSSYDRFTRSVSNSRGPLLFWSLTVFSLIKEYKLYASKSPYSWLNPHSG